MDVIETVHAEPRELVNSPVYRVNFWQRQSPEQAWNLDAYALTGVEGVTEVLRWANNHALGRRFEVFAEIDEIETGSFEAPRTAGLVRLFGTNPNAGERLEIGGFHKL